MAKLKSFEEYIADIDSAEEIEQDIVDMGEPSTVKDDDELTSNDQEKGGQLDPDRIQGDEVGLEPGDMEGPLETGEEDEHINGKPIDSEPEDKSADIEDQMEDPSEPKSEVEESFVTEDEDEDDDLDDDEDEDDDSDDDEDEDDDSDDDSDEDDKKPSKSVEAILKEAYEACKYEAKVWEEDMHDTHTVESYMKENQALVASLAINTLKEMREEMTLEMYEASCNELKEAYAKKMDELKEAWTAEGEEVKED